MLIPQKDFIELAGVSRTAIAEWRKLGFPVVKDGQNVMVDIIEGLSWQHKHTKTSPLKLDNYSQDEEDLSVEDQLRVKRMEKLDLEMAISKGEYIPIDEVDDTTAQMVSLLINQFRQLLKTLPNQLAKKTETQIKKSLDLSFKMRVEELEKMFQEEANADRQENPSSN